jgi:hypothetical protein
VTNIDNGCLYAQQNGFTAGGKNGRQNVLMHADVTSPPPTAPGVVSQYWVTVRVTETIPQLFSSILGNNLGVTSSRATAALAKSVSTGALILLNRQNDCMAMDGPQPVCGIDLLVQANDNQGMYALHTDGGILMASLNNGTNNPDGHYAGENQGGGTVDAGYTYIRGEGWYMNQGSATWQPTPVNGKADTGFFKDPLRKYYQPPPPTNLQEPVGAFENGVPNGVIIGSDDPNNPLVLHPGSYYASAWNPTTNDWEATGDPVRISGSVHFSGDGGFAEYVFYGGISAAQQGPGSTAFKFDPGMYVFAGAKPKANGDPNPVFDITTNLTMTDGSPPFVPDADHPGELFLFTDPDYVGYDGVAKQAVTLNPPARVQSIASQLKFGTSGFQAGNNTDVVITLRGLNKNKAIVPDNLKVYEAPTLMWQDRRNSVIKYYDDPTDPTDLNQTCITGDTPCMNSELLSDKSPELFFKASPGSWMYGIIYQPRGSWTTMGGGSGYSGPLQIVTGGFKVQGNANLNLLGLNNPIMVPMAALVE